ncbi:MAG TPA: protein kinase [Opitutaceae bacterium]|nr:protein kinase [Opitutaceae bacterium]
MSNAAKVEPPGAAGTMHIGAADVLPTGSPQIAPDRPAAAPQVGITAATPSKAEPVLKFFGDYTVLGEIAAGGMGVVYLARHRKLNRTVALKMIRAGSLAQEDALRRFRIEAEAAANLDHPNIVPIYELGEHEGRHYFSMKFVEGESLHDLNAKCPARDLKWLRHAAALMVKIARAVQHAHERAILHRDLKPRNILIDESGEPHVTDFGLAKVLGQTTHETMAEAIMGTPHFMSPEQAAGRTRDVTTAADVYSLGAMLFDLLVGAPPFKGDTLLRVIEQVREAAPPNPAQLNPAVPRDLATICLKCLEKEPQHRYASAGVLADELERWIAGEPILARPATPLERVTKWVRRNPRLAFALGLAMLSALVAVIGITWQWRRAEHNFTLSQQRKARLEIQFAEDFFNDDNPAAALATLARVLRDDPDNRVAAARIINRLHHRRVLAPFTEPLGAGVGLAIFAGDGRVVVAGTNSHGWVVTLSRPGLSGFALELPHGTNRVIAAAVSRDGRFAATGLETGARLWSAVEGKLLREFRWETAVPFVGFRDSPGGPALAAVTNDTVLLCAADTGAVMQQFATAGEAIVATALSPDGRRLAVATEERTLRICVLDRAGDWITITNAHRGGVVRSLAFSQDGRLLVSAGTDPDRTARIWKTDTGELTFTLHADDSMLHAEFNATGTLVVTAARDRVAQVWDTRTGQPAAPALVHPKAAKAVNTARFSPDGQWILTACEDGVARVWSAESGQLAAATPATTRGLSDAAFGPAGRRILTIADGASARVWTMLGGRGALPSQLDAGSSFNELLARRTALPAAELAKYSAAHSDVVVFSDAATNGWFAATASRDRTARLWDRRTGKPVSDPLLHDATVNCAQFSADGATLATSTSSRRIRLWDTRTGQPVTDWITSESPVAKVGLSADGHYVVTAAGEVWSVYAEMEKPPPWLPGLAESAAGLRYRDNPNRLSEPVPAASLAALRQEISSLAAPNWLTRWANELLHELPAEQNP